MQPHAEITADEEDESSGKRRIPPPQKQTLKRIGGQLCEIKDAQCGQRLQGTEAPRHQQHCPAQGQPQQQTGPYPPAPQAAEPDKIEGLHHAEGAYAGQIPASQHQQEQIGQQGDAKRGAY